MSRVALNELIFVATNPASYARRREVFVYARGTEDEATIYAAEVGGSVLAQPLVTDEGGRPRGSGDILGWVEEGSYDLSADGQVIPWEAAKGGGVPDLSNYQTIDQKGSANGYAGLEAAGKVPASQLPSAIMEYQGTWNASTNSPKLEDGKGSAGDTYRISFAGERNLGSGVISFEVGDYAVYNGSVWEKSDTTDAVASVAGKKGAVVLVQADIEGLVAALEGKQPLDSDLTAIAALSTTSYGRAFLALANGAAARTALELGTAATQASTAFDAAGAAAAAQAASQPLDSDLTAIAALTTTTFGRSLLALADAAAARSAIEAQKSLGFTAEDSANKDTTATLGTSDTKYPSQKAVKTYVDAEKTDREAADAGKQFAIGGLFDVKNPTYAAKGDGATDDSTAIQAAITAASAAGGVVYFPPGTYIINATLTLQSKVHLRGAGPEVTVLKLKNGAKTNVLKSANYGAAGIRDFSIRDLAVNGNSANNSEGSGVLIDGQKFLIENVEIHHCATDNLNCQQTAETVLDTEGGDEVFVRNVRCWLAGSRNIRWDIRDGHLVDVIAICKDEAGTRTNILIDSNGFAVKCLNCHAWGYSKYAWQVKGQIEAVNCNAEGGGTANVIWEGDNNVWVGGQVFKDGSGHGEVGFLWANEKGFSSLIHAVQIRGCAEPLKFIGNGAGSKISGIIELGAGKKAVNGGPSANEVSFDLYVHGGGTVGNAQKARLSAPEAASILREHLVDGDTNARMETRADGLILWGPGNAGTDVWLSRPEKEVLKVSGRLQIEKKSEEVASASTITVKDGISLVKISGSAEIKKVNATTAGHLVTFLILASAKFADGENLKLTAAGPVTADDTITMICDGTNWYEIGRAVN